MTLSALAWASGHPALVTFDGTEVLAYDGETEAPKWRLDVGRPIVGLVLADATGLDIGDAGAPFRTPSAAAAVLAVDADGKLHVIDASSGRLLGGVGPAGATRAIAASATGSAIAVATADAVLVFRKAARAEVALKATALAFSHDGTTLGVGTKDGTLKTFDISAVESEEKLVETLSVAGSETVVDLAHHPSGAWVVGVPSGIVVVDAPGQARRLDKIRSGPKRFAFDAAGARLAVQLTDRQVLVYEWPALSVLTRIEYTDRPVRGLAFGGESWLGVALDHGDGNKIDVVSAAVHRTDTHPGRTHRSWTLFVEGKKERLTEKEAEDIRRMKSPSSPSPSPVGGRLGIGAVITMALLGLRVCAAASRSSSHSYSPPSFPPIPTATARCDRACATERLRTLRNECATARHACEDGAERALAAIATGDCARATSALDGIGKPEAPNAPLLNVSKLLAELGVREACRDGAIRPNKTPHARLVHLAGPGAEPTVEVIPGRSVDAGETPRAIWAAPDGTVFVTAAVADSTTVLIHRRSPAGDWEILRQQSAVDEGTSATIFGRSSSDVYATIDGSLLHFDGKAWSKVATPATDVTSAAAAGADVLVVAGAARPQVFRRRGDGWSKEPTGDLEIEELRGGASAFWALARANDDRVVAQRSADGRWTTPVLGADAGSAEPLALWVSPSGDPFVVTDESVVRGTAKGTRWSEDELDGARGIKAMWGRSSSDVYAATPLRLFHFDGKAWSATSYEGSIAALAGTAKEVLVVRADD